MSTWQGGKQRVYFLWLLWEREWEGKKTHTDHFPCCSRLPEGSCPLSLSWAFEDGGGVGGGSNRKMVGIKSEWERTDMRDAGGKWIKVCGWGNGVWANREIVPNLVTVLNTWLPPWPSDSCERTPLLPPTPEPSSQTSDPPPISLSFFQVCCTRGGKDRIYHLSAFGSPELRDAGQHKIIIHRHEITKPPGDPTTKLSNFFFPSQKYKEVCLLMVFFLTDRQRDVGFDMMEEKILQKDILGKLSFTVVVWWKKKQPFQAAVTSEPL